MTPTDRPTTEAGRALLGPEEDERPECAHPDSWFDRTECACGSMHDVCTECYWVINCPLDTAEARREQRQAEADCILAIEAEARAAALAEARRQLEVLEELNARFLDDEGDDYGGIPFVPLAAVLTILGEQP